MDLSIKFAELNSVELFQVEAGKAYDVGYQVGKYIGLGLTFIKVYFLGI